MSESETIIELHKIRTGLAIATAAIVSRVCTDDYGIDTVGLDLAKKNLEYIIRTANLDPQDNFTKEAERLYELVKYLCDGNANEKSDNDQEKHE